MSEAMTFNLIFKLYDFGFTVERERERFFFLFVDYSKKETEMYPRRGRDVLWKGGRTSKLFLSHFGTMDLVFVEKIITKKKLILWFVQRDMEWKQSKANRKYYISSREMVIVTLFMQIGLWVFLPMIIHFNKRLVSRVGKYYSP